MLPSMFRQLKQIGWNFREAKTGLLTHDYHPYPAKFIPQIPRHLITNLSQKKDLVLDPFVGCGTTLVEANLLGRNSIGVDVNPLASLISKVKATSISPEVIDKFSSQLLTCISSEINSLYGQLFVDDFSINHLKSTEGRPRKVDYPIPSVHNRDYWFKKSVLKELSIIKGNIEKIQHADFKDFLLVCLSSIIVRVSNQDSDTRYVRRQKNIKPHETFLIFKNKLQSMIKKMKEFAANRQDVSVKVYCHDSRHLEFLDDDSVDLVVTSPPYLNAWDYHLYHRFRLFWLGMDPIKLKKEEIGAHLEHSYNTQSIQRYSNDMKLCMNEMYRVLKKKKYVCIVIGDSIVKGEIVNSHEILMDLAEQIGLEFMISIEREIDASSKSFNPLIGNIKKEHILIFEKVD